MSEKIDPQVNEMWVTKSGRTCRIVWTDGNVALMLGLLWYDEIDKDWVTTRQLNQLERKATTEEAKQFSKRFLETMV